MTPNVESLAWLERPDGSCEPIEGNCSLGRVPGNQVVLPDERVSRRHAIVHAQGEAEFWIVDLGSSNGTYVNGRRLGQPSRLRHGDLIQIGSFQLVFRERSGREADPSGTLLGATRTLVAVKTSPCWLLLMDIEGSTVLSRRLEPESIAVLIGHWFARCKEVIEGGGGAINKYLGDGLFAYWPAEGTGPGQLLAVLEALRGLQAAGEPNFRLLLHYSPVVMGGMASMGEESLSGMGVNFIFRMEKLAASLGQSRLISDAAARQLGPGLATVPVGTHPLAGFEGEYPFLSF